MTTYNIKLVSQTNAAVLIIILSASLIGGIFLFIPHGVPRSSAIIITLVAFTVAFFLWQKFVTGKTEWTIDNNGVYMTWIKQFSFTNNADLTLKWYEIESIGEGFDTNYDDLKIKLVSGEMLKFYHPTVIMKDDYGEFIITLYQKFNEHKKHK